MPSPKQYGPTTAGNVTSTFPQIFDQTLFGGSGGWRAYATTDVGSVSVSGLSVQVGSVAITGSPLVTVSNPLLAISGIVTAAVAIGNVAVTGGAINIVGTPTVTVGNAVVAVSGSVNAAVTGGSITLLGTQTVLVSGGYLGITGVVPVSIAGTAAANDITGNLYLAAISGLLTHLPTGNSVATISNPIGITGTATDLNSVYTGVGIAPYVGVPIMGRVVNVTGNGTLAAYQTGQYAMLSINGANGACLVNQGVLDYTQDTVTSVPYNTGIAMVSTVSGINNGGAGVALPSNPFRRSYFIQNVSTGALLVNLSANLPTTGAFHFILKGASSLTAGDGGSWSSEPTSYTGPISITGVGQSSPAYVAWQL